MIEFNETNIPKKIKHHCKIRSYYYYIQISINTLLGSEKILFAIKSQKEDERNSLLYKKSFTYPELINNNKNLKYFESINDIYISIAQCLEENKFSISNNIKYLCLIMQLYCDKFGKNVNINININRHKNLNPLSMSNSKKKEIQKIMLGIQNEEELSYAIYDIRQRLKSLEQNQSMMTMNNSKINNNNYNNTITNNINSYDNRINDIKKYINNLNPNDNSYINDNSNIKNNISNNNTTIKSDNNYNKYIKYINKSKTKNENNNISQINIPKYKNKRNTELLIPKNLEMNKKYKVYGVNELIKKINDLVTTLKNKDEQENINNHHHNMNKSVEINNRNNNNSFYDIKPIKTSRENNIKNIYNNINIKNSYNKEKALNGSNEVDNNIRQTMNKSNNNRNINIKNNSFINNIINNNNENNIKNIHKIKKRNKSIDYNNQNMRTIDVNNNKNNQFLDNSELNNNNINIQIKNKNLDTDSDDTYEKEEQIVINQRNYDNNILTKSKTTKVKNSNVKVKVKNKDESIKQSKIHNIKVKAKINNIDNDNYIYNNITNINNEENGKNNNGKIINISEEDSSSGKQNLKKNENDYNNIKNIDNNSKTKKKPNNAKIIQKQNFKIKNFSTSKKDNESIRTSSSKPIVIKNMNKSISSSMSNLKIQPPKNVPIFSPEKLSNYVDSVIIFRKSELQLLKEKISHNKKNVDINFNLIYRATRDGDNDIVIKKIALGYKRTLTLFYTVEGARFGVYIRKKDLHYVKRKERIEKPGTCFIIGLNNLVVYNIFKDKFGKGDFNQILCFGSLDDVGSNGTKWMIYTPQNNFLNKKCVMGSGEGLFKDIDIEQIIGPSEYTIKDVEIFNIEIEHNDIDN